MVHLAIKYVFRLLHIGSYGVFSAFLLGDYLTPEGSQRLSKSVSSGFHALLGIILLASGLINMIILIIENKFKKDSNMSVWKYLLYAKVGLFLLLTPLYDKFIAPFFGINSEVDLIKAKLIFFTLALLLSPFTRFFREKYLIKQVELENDSNLVKNE